MPDARALLQSMAQVGEALLDLVAPRTCAGCGAPMQLLCEACRQPLEGAPALSVPDPCPAGLPPTWAVTPYVGTVRAVLLAHKERNRLGLAGPLGLALSRSVSAAVPDPGSPVALVPVPSSRAATRRRGHDPLLRCAQVAARVLRESGRPTTVLPLLAQGRPVADQSGLGAASRAENLAGAHRVRARRAAAVGPGIEVVVVDDLVTTGASLAEAARALRDTGLEPCAAAVVAATPRRSRLDRSGRNA